MSPSSRRAATGAVSLGAIVGASLIVAAPAVAATDADCTPANTVDAATGSAADIQALLTANAPLVCLTGAFTIPTALTSSSPLTLHGTGTGASLTGGGTNRILSSSSEATVENLSFSGGRAADGGALSVSGSLTIVDSVFVDNRASQGSAVLTFGTLTVRSSVFRENVGTAYGSAILSYGTATIESSTFEDNTASYYGGAVDVRGTLALRNSTFVGNQGSAGAVFAFDGSVISSTFLDNSSALNFSSSVTIVGSVFASSGTQPQQVATAAGQNVTDGGGNVFTSAQASETEIIAVAPSSRFGVAAADLFTTGVLADNGGPTPTLALNPTGPAIDVVPAGAAPNDQRGQTRSGLADAGAFEYVAPVVPPVAPAPAAPTLPPTGASTTAGTVVAGLLLAVGGLVATVGRRQGRRRGARA